jgi:hypothetical protein
MTLMMDEKGSIPQEQAEAMCQRMSMKKNRSSIDEENLTTQTQSEMMTLMKQQDKWKKW